MRPLVLHGFGTSVRVNGRTLEIDWRSEDRKGSYRPQQLPFDSVVVDSLTGSVSFEALRFLAVHDVPVTLLRWNGSVLSTILPRGPSNGALRVAQVEAYGNSEKRLKISREFIREKVAKTLELGAELERTLPYSTEAVRMESKGDQGASLNDLRLYESRVASAHWREFAKVVDRLWPKSGFASRRSAQRSWSNSAADPTNALLNYGYSLLESSCRGAISSVGLLPEVGFLHEVAPSKFPLSYDLQEPFRWIVDLSVIEVLRDGKLDRKADFIVTENYHVRLRATAAKALVERLSANFNRKVTVRGRNYSYETLVQETARQLARSILEAKARFNLSVPFAVAEWGYAGEDAGAKIAAMSYAEAGKLGISKAGLWDMKRRIAEGKHLRLYAKVADRLG